MRVSIAMCTYNGARFLPEQLASIRAQTLQPFELVVCDDGSTDTTPALIEQFASEVPFPVRWVRNERNLGSTKNFEQAIGLCTGELIALCDQDDVWMPAKLARLASVLDTRPEAGAAFSNAGLIDADGMQLNGSLWNSVGFTPSEKQVFETDTTYFLIKRPLVTGATLVFRAPLVERIVPISKEWVHDEWIALIISAIANIYPVHEQLIQYRLHDAQQIGLRRIAASVSLRKKQSQRAEFHKGIGCKLSAMEAKLKTFPGHSKSVTYAAEKAAYMHRRANLLSGSWLPRVPLGVALMRGHMRYGHGLSSYLRDLVHD